MSDEVSPAVPRVGLGFDAHPLNQVPPLLLGGVQVSDTHGLEATSDGDVLSHAVADAILGACSLGDIGDHFPSGDPASRGASSLRILDRVVEMAAEVGWRVSHVDATVVAEQIRVSPHRDLIRSHLAGALKVDERSVSVKATSTDGLGFAGRGEGVAAFAVVTMTALP